jgi:hypothetical protein
MPKEHQLSDTQNAQIIVPEPQSSRADIGAQ